MPGTVSTACSTFQATLRHVWHSGSTIAEIVDSTGITKDQLIRLRTVLELPLRLDRSKRAKPPRHKDPTPDQIAKACAALRAKHLEQRKAEDPRRVYPKSENDFVRFRVERERSRQDDWLERLMDDFHDP